MVPIDPKTSYEIPASWTFIRKVGSGAYGTVCSFQRGGEKVAVKKIQNAFDDLIDAKRILREIKILRKLDHENIIKILDILPPQGPDFEDIYIVTELMETDLHRVIYSKQTLTDEHFQYFLPDPTRPQVSSFSQHHPQRSQAQQHSRGPQLSGADLRLRTS